MPEKHPSQLFVALIAQLQATQGRKLTNTELAEILGTTQSSISRLLSGDLSIKQVEWLIKLLSMIPEDRRTLELNNFFKETK
jgi:predicted XRE-type DNA-binding protein